jgi:glycopeptide antibiotics resistance protein
LTIACLLWMALRPGHAADTLNLRPFHESLRALRCLLSACPAASGSAQLLFVNVLGNVAVFFPIGLALAGALGPGSRARQLGGAIGLGAGLSLAIELAQLGIPGRATDVDDFIFNTLGAALGAACLVAVQRRLARDA